jgi:hypothetical protein
MTAVCLSVMLGVMLLGVLTRAYPEAVRRVGRRVEAVVVSYGRYVLPFAFLGAVITLSVSLS